MLQSTRRREAAPNLHRPLRAPSPNLAVDSDAIIKFVLNGLGDRVATGVNPMAFGWDPALKPYRQDLAQAKKLLAEAGYPNGVDVLFHEGPPIVEPAIQQTNDAIVADMAKAGFRVKRNYIGDNRCSWPGSRTARRADVQLVVGLLLRLRRRRHPLRVFKCGENYSYSVSPSTI